MESMIGEQGAETEKIVTFFERGVKLCVGIGLSIGILVLVGWQFEIELLKSVLPHYITMKANTAVGLAALALSLFFLRHENHAPSARMVGLFFAGLTFLIGILTLSEYLFGWNLGIDELLFVDNGAAGKTPPGRLAPVTAVMFTIMSTAIFICNFGKLKFYRTAQILLIISFVTALQAIVGYLSGVSSTFGVAFHVRIAVHTAFAVVALTIGIMFSRPNRGLMTIVMAESAGGYLARRLIASAILVPPLVNLLQIFGQNLGLYDADFGVLIRVMGNVVFFTIIIWRTSVSLHHMDLHRQSSEERRSETEAALRLKTEAAESLKEGSRMKSQFLANMSHEIRTPINGVIGMTTLLAETPLSAEQEELVRNIKFSADSLLSVINDILDFSKIEAGKMEIENLDFDLDRSISDVGKLMSFTARQKGLNFAVKNSCALSHTYRGDQGRIRQVLLNLLSNAIKFTQKGRVELLVSSVLEGASERFKFEVVDTGIGLAKNVIDRLFQAFSQADSSMSRRFGGSGLGLSISRRLAELMGGKLGVVSVEGKGSTFWFEVPLERLEEKSVAMELERANSKARPMGKREKILVAEDNSINQRVAIGLLEKLNYRALAVANGFEVLDVLKTVHCDLILMDCQMPEMDGYEATMAVRADKKNPAAQIPIVAMTANAIAGDRERCLKAGMNDYISKPVRLDELARILRKWLDKSQNSGDGSGSSADKSTIAMNDIPVIDRAVFDQILELAAGSGKSLASDLVETLAEALTTVVPKMREALRADDIKTLRAESHSLKSGSGNLGAMRVSSICATLEKGDDPGARALLVEQLATEIHQAVGELRRILAGNINHRAA